MPTLNRSAKSGKFVTKAKAKKSPGTTVRETIDKLRVYRSGKLLKNGEDYTCAGRMITLLKPIK